MMSVYNVSTRSPFDAWNARESPNSRVTTATRSAINHCNRLRKSFIARDSCSKRLNSSGVETNSFGQAAGSYSPKRKQVLGSNCNTFAVFLAENLNVSTLPNRGSHLENREIHRNDDESDHNA